MSQAELDAAFNDQQQGILLELSSIIAGAGKNALDNMLGDTFTAEPPTVDVCQEFTGPAEAVMVNLGMTTQGTTPFVFILDALTAANLSNVLMGMPSSEAVTASDISDIQLSATGEIMSQMMGVAANHLSQLFGSSVNFTTPEATIYSEEVFKTQNPGMTLGDVVVITYNLIPSAAGSAFGNGIQLIQLATKTDLDTLVSMIETTHADEADSSSDDGISIDPPPSAQSGTPPQVTVQPVQFGSLDGMNSALGELNQNLSLVQDIMLNMTVELGRSEITIREVLELTRGSVIELDRLAGEPVDLLANGKLIAKGEIVVIEDNFGFRVTSIVSPQERLVAI